MKTSDVFSYDLPVQRIAERPVYPYDSARLLIVDRQSGHIGESTFRELPQALNQEDLLLFNTSRVIPSRLFGTITTSDAPVELLVTRREGSQGEWICIGKPLKKLRPGVRIRCGNLMLKVIERISEKEIRVEASSLCEKAVDLVLEEEGIMPIPPYIRRGRGDAQDRKDYQSMFAREDGSIAAPTASLHFTESLMRTLSERGIAHDFVSLHVGAPSFLPLWEEGASEEVPSPGAESFQCSPSVFDKIYEARSRGARVIPVGTTVLRAIETGASAPTMEGWRTTELFISPGYTFRAATSLITNFHQPRTTHLVLVQALLGKELLSEAYHFALSREYRFLSYGDGMLIL